MAAQLALRPRDAARALGVSERWLWQKTKAGEIPCLKSGRCNLYPVAMLEEWLRSRAVGKHKEQQPQNPLIRSATAEGGDA
jgi:hypothetical protein